MNWIEYNNKKSNGKYLFKFLSEENLIRFLDSGNLWFARSDKFGDKMECLSVHDFTGKAFNLQNIKRRQRNHLISCFHVSTHESLAFWDTYSKTDNERRKYAIRFIKEDLIKLVTNSEAAPPSNLKTGIYGNIKYKNLISADAATLLDAKVKHPSFRKESVFSYEQEFRFVLQLKSESTSAGFNLNIGNPDQLRFHILVNPLLLKTDFLNSLRFVRSSGFKDKFALSKLTKWVKPELSTMLTNLENKKANK